MTEELRGTGCRGVADCTPSEYDDQGRGGVAGLGLMCGAEEGVCGAECAVREERGIGGAGCKAAAARRRLPPAPGRRRPDDEGWQPGGWGSVVWDVFSRLGRGVQFWRRMCSLSGRMCSLWRARCSVFGGTSRSGRGTEGRPGFPTSAGSGQISGDAGMTGMCPPGQADVSSEKGVRPTRLRMANRWTHRTKSNLVQGHEPVDGLASWSARGFVRLDPSWSLCRPRRQAQGGLFAKLRTA